VFDGFPFFYRVALLVGLTIVGVTVDFWGHGREAARYREYGFVWIAGILGGFIGFANDCVTSSISPDYFILGKGLEPGNDLRLQAGVYGFKAGLSAGLVGGAVCLFARSRKSGFSSQQMSRLMRMLWMPAATAFLFGLALPFMAGGIDPMGLAARLDSLLTVDQIIRFKRVWWIHTGMYAGLVLGLIAMISRDRRQSPSPSEEEC
jgi:hypothetical protein